MSALRLLFSSDVFLPRGYALGWEPVLLVVDAASHLLLVAGVAALLVRALRASRQHLPLRSRALALFAGILVLGGLVDVVGLWWACPGLASLLRAAAGISAALAARAPRAAVVVSSGPPRDAR